MRTPNLDRLARDGVIFDSALCPSPLCAPSRACLAAGKVYDRCRVPGNQVDYPLDQPTYYQKLRDEGGYHVAGVGKFDLHKATRDWGLDGKRLLLEWGFSAGIDNEGKYDGVGSGAEEPKGPYLAFLHERGLAQAHVEDFRQRHGFRDTFPTPLPEEAYCDNWIAANGLGLLRDFPKDRPWHLVINFTGPHNPMREVVSSGLGKWRVAFDGRFKLVRFEDGVRLLFDLEEDPWEDRDIAGRAGGEVERLERLLDREIAGDGN